MTELCDSVVRVLTDTRVKEGQLQSLVQEVVGHEGGNVRIISVGVLHLQGKVVHALVSVFLEVPA